MAKTIFSVRSTFLIVTIIIAMLVAGVGIVLVFSNATPTRHSDTAAVAQTSPSPLPATYIPPTLQPLTATVEPFSRLGRPLPDSLLQTLDGEFISFDQYQGQILVVNFWAVWCPPCVREMPALQAFYESAGDDVAIIAVTDPANGQSMTEILEFLDQNNLDQLPIGLDQHMTIHSQLAIQQLPTTLFVDAKGVIRQEHSGEMTTETLLDLVDKVRQLPDAVD